MTTRTRTTPATVARMAAAGYEAKHAGHPGVTWASAVKSTRDVWTLLATAVAKGEIDTERQLFEAWSSGRDMAPWPGSYTAVGRKWQSVLAAMRIARTEESHD